VNEILQFDASKVTFPAARRFVGPQDRQDPAVEYLGRGQTAQVNCCVGQVARSLRVRLSLEWSTIRGVVITFLVLHLMAIVVLFSVIVFRWMMAVVIVVRQIMCLVVIGVMVRWTATGIAVRLAMRC
jgi:hypothetical protein